MIYPDSMDLKCAGTCPLPSDFLRTKIKLSYVESLWYLPILFYTSWGNWEALSLRSLRRINKQKSSRYYHYYLTVPYELVGNFKEYVIENNWVLADNYLEYPSDLNFDHFILSFVEPENNDILLKEIMTWFTGPYFSVYYSNKR
jgi:hypothetical protein